MILVIIIPRNNYNNVYYNIQADGIKVCLRYLGTGARPMIRSGKKGKQTFYVTYPAGVIVDVSVNLPKSASNFLLSEFRSIGRVPVFRFAELFEVANL
jgi:hypothetical protein